MQHPVFVHASDLHLGSPLGGLGRGLSEEHRRALIERADKVFDNLISETIRVNAEFLVIAGDVYDDGECEPAIVERFSTGLQKLIDAGIGVYLIHGNHDPMTEKRSTVISLPNAVKVFAPWTPIDGDPSLGPTGTVEQFTHELRDGRSVVIAGVSYRSDHEPHNLTPLFDGLRREGSCAVIGILHTGTKGGRGSYAPCTERELESKSVDYWALGHIHKREVSEMGVNRYWAYCGNPQGRDIGEPGVHGALVVPILERGVGRPSILELDEFRFFEVVVDCDGLEGENVDSLVPQIRISLEKLAQKKPLIVRLKLVGHSSLVKVPLEFEPGSLEVLLTGRMSSESLNGGYVEEASSELLPPIDMKQLRQRDDIVGEVVRLAENVDPIPLLRDQLDEGEFLSDEEVEQLRSMIKSELIAGIVRYDEVSA